MNKVLNYILLLVLVLNVGCTTKKYVNQQVVPIINKVNDLDQRAAANTHDLAATNESLDQVITALNPTIAEADSRATTADQRSTEANRKAQQAATRTQSLENTIKNADNYQSVREVSIQFGPDEDQLDDKAAETIQDFASRVPEKGAYVLTLKGNTDATGPHEHNYELSKRRATAVAAYLATKFHIPPYRIFFVGLGPDQPVAENKTRSGRSQNRRVEVTLFTNAPSTQAGEEPAQNAAMK